MKGIMTVKELNERAVSEWITEYQKKPFNYAERALTDYLVKPAIPILVQLKEMEVPRVNNSRLKSRA